MKRPPQWYLDFVLRLRPGAFEANAKLMLGVVRAAARAKEPEVVFCPDALRGGDCGSLNDHPAFQMALARAQEKFLRDVKRIRNAPQVKFARVKDESILEGAGPDPRFPFCGRPGDVYARQVTELARRLATIGVKDVVLGLSGGLDSTLALLVAVGAFRLLQLDLAGIHVYTLPGFGTTKRTRGNADLLVEGLGLSMEAVDITPLCRQHFKDLRQPVTRHDVVFENTQARVRTLFLMDKANQLGGIVLGTGDMSEIALGWSTYNGDHMSMYGVNAGVPKTTVREVCSWWADNVRGLDVGSAQAAAVIDDVVATPVSPELLPAKRGKIDQKTEDRIGPYELHDFFLWHFVAENEGRAEILKAAKAVFKGVYDAKTIAKWLDLFLRRFFSQAFKRNCAPDGTQVFRVYLAPGAWHMPGNSCMPL